MSNEEEEWGIVETNELFRKEEVRYILLIFLRDGEVSLGFLKTK